MIRTQILEGRLQLPNQDKFNNHFGQDGKIASKLFQGMWYQYLLNKGSVNLTYWAERFYSVKNFNTILKVLSDNKWIVSHSIPTRRWAEAELNEDKLLEYVTPDELAHVRATNKFAKYRPEYLESKHNNLTKQNGKVANTGLVRYGFEASGKTPFAFDTATLVKYEKAIIQNVIKGMTKVREFYPNMQTDEASYDAVSAAIVKDLVNNPDYYTMGSNFSDSRGRAIKEALSKVCNPIGYKDFRALLVIPKEFRDLATEDGVRSIYLFIAELFGFKNGTVKDKELRGKKAYEEREYHQLDLAKEEDRDELHENIWLERIYNELDQYFNQEIHYWSVPIELDASASMLQHLGVLLGDERLLTMTNVLDNGELNDPWHIEGVDRQTVKKPFVPLLYGSSKPIHELLINAKIEYTLQDIQTLTNELANGAFGLANDFKEFIIKYVKPKEVMNIHVYEDKFQVQCNRFRNVGEETHKYDIYDSITDSIRRVSHTKTKKVADLEQFRRWFVTGLVHAQDSQVADFVMESVMDTYGWGLDIHDAFLVSPEAADHTRNQYAEEMEVIFNNRETILNNYFQSIGIGREALPEWRNITDKIHKVTSLKVSPMALK